MADAVAGAGVGGGACAGAAAGVGAPALARTSPLVTLPSRPLPDRLAVSRPRSSAILRAAGLGAPDAAGAAAGAAGDSVDGVEAGGLFGAPTASVSMRARTSSLSAVSPDCLTISVSTPAADAGTSSTTLSVSNSMRISSRSTDSPTCFLQSRRVASGMDSARTGTLISTSTGLSSERTGDDVAGLEVDSGLHRGWLEPCAAAHLVGMAMALLVPLRTLSLAVFCAVEAERRVDERALLLEVHVQISRGGGGGVVASRIGQLVPLAE